MTIQRQLDLWDTESAVPALLTVREAGRLLAISRSSVYELIGAGKLETVHIGRSVRVPADALIAYVASLREEPPSGATGRFDGIGGGTAEGRPGVNR